MPETSDFAVGTTFIFISYMFQCAHPPPPARTCARAARTDGDGRYVMTAGLFEFTHPNGALSKQLSEEKRKARMLQVRDELELGVCVVRGWALGGARRSPGS